jgi:hypothetical protein
VKLPRTPIPAFIVLGLLIELPLILFFYWITLDSNQVKFDSWAISDWLINYQGGFVRRGLAGEVLLRLSSADHLLQNLYYFVFGCYLIHVAFTLWIYRLARINNWRLLLIGVVMQGGIFHMGLSLKFFTRKEILFLIGFEILCLIYLKICQSHDSQKNFWIRWFSIVLLLTTPLLILVHEGYLFMAFPVTLLLVWILKTENPGQPYLKQVMALFIIEVVATFMISSFNHGSIAISQAIWDAIPFGVRLALSPANPHSPIHAIAAVGWGLDQHLVTLYWIFSGGGFWLWLLVIAGNVLTLGYVMSSVWGGQSNQVGPSRFLRYGLLAMLLSGSMFGVGYDWGRWLAYWSSQALLLVWTLNQSPSASEQDSAAWVLRFGQALRAIRTPALLVVILVFGLLFHMPEGAGDYRQFWPTLWGSLPTH